MGNYLTELSFESSFNSRCRTAYADWLNDSQFNIALTLNFNSQVDLDTARRAIGNCFFQIDRKLLGTRFTSRRAERTVGIFAFEHLDTNLHAHGLLNVKLERLCRFAEMFSLKERNIWQEVWPSGSHWLTEAYDPAGFVKYFLKEQRANSDPNTIIFLEDFFPSGD